MAVGEAKRRRVEAAPACLRDRVERDEPLPEVDIGTGQDEEKKRGSPSESGEEDKEEEEKGEKLRAVVQYVVEQMEGPAVGGLRDLMRPRWERD